MLRAVRQVVGIFGLEGPIFHFNLQTIDIHCAKYTGHIRQIFSKFDLDL